MTKDEEEVLRIERLFWEASGENLFQERFADDGYMVAEPMGVVKKPQSIEMVKQSKSFTDVKFQDQVVTTLTPDVIAIAYHGSGSQEGHDQPYHGSILSVYRKKDGKWQLTVTAHQPWTPKQ